MTKHINRRIFLRGLGGAVVAAPFLTSLADLSATFVNVPANQVDAQIESRWTRLAAALGKNVEWLD